MQSDVSRHASITLGQLDEHSIPGVRIESQSNDVKQIGGLLCATTVHDRLKFHRYQRARFGHPGRAPHQHTIEAPGDEFNLRGSVECPRVGSGMQSITGIITRLFKVPLANLQHIDSHLALPGRK